MLLFLRPGRTPRTAAVTGTDDACVIANDIVDAGDAIRFEMDNVGEQAHEFEVLDPAGDALGEVAATNPDESGGATMTFTSPGMYTYQCILVDPSTGQPHTELGMIGTFDVAPG